MHTAPCPSYCTHHTLLHTRVRALSSTSLLSPSPNPPTHTALATPPPPTPVSPPSSFFLSHAPRDASEGLAEGLKSIALGVGAGVAGLVGMPLVGARNEGVSGFFKGLGAGVLGAVVLPTMGVVNGVMEIGGGIVNTPEVSEGGKKKTEKMEERESVLGRCW